MTVPWLLGPGVRDAIVYKRKRKPVIAERVEQANGVTLLRSIGGRVWVLGTKRRRDDHPGTMQTPGIPDVWAFLPAPRFPGARAQDGPTGLWWEAKRTGGTRSPMQEMFADCCQLAGVAYVCGDLDALFAFLIEGGWLLKENVAHYRREHMTAREP